ncbi:MAG: GtrA family protein [Alphaproteobacteria bacterium]|nr:GtrA family protein [Alphaproteobacteria bacterium]
MSVQDLVRRTSQSRFIRFATVGTAGFLVNEAALAVAKELLGMGDHAAWFFGFAISVTFTWWGNRTFTFADKASDHHIGILAEWARFVATNSLGAAANFAVYAACIHYAPWPVSTPYLALAVGTVIGLIFNFTLSKLIVFRD